MSLEELLKLAPAGVLLVGLIGLYFAIRQIRTYRLFELIKILEAPNVRAARRTVIRKLSKKENGWWEVDPEKECLERDAALVCATYDILGRMIQYDWLDHCFPGSYAKFFRQYWGPSILDAHDVLKDYLWYRRRRFADAYGGFTKLAEDAARQQTHPRGPLQPN
jgi:hypothetical protein